MALGSPEATTLFCVSPYQLLNFRHMLIVVFSPYIRRSTPGLHSRSVTVLEFQWSLLQAGRCSAWRMLLVHTIPEVQDWHLASSEHHPP